MLLWLFPKAYNRKGKLVPVDLSILTRWQIIDNLRRSLLSPGIFVIMLLGMTILPGPPLRWIFIALSTLFLPVFRSLLSIQDVIQSTKSFLHTVGQVLVNIITLPFQSVLLLDAVIRTVYRLMVSKRQLLEWVTSSGGRAEVIHKSKITSMDCIVVIC